MHPQHVHYALRMNKNHGQVENHAASINFD